MTLLHHHIHQKNPTTTIKIFRSWPQETLEDVDLSEALGIYGDTENDHYYHDGQGTYWDTELWTWFKDAVQPPDVPKYGVPHRPEHRRSQNWSGPTRSI
jgi:hypothetical protein